MVTVQRKKRVFKVAQKSLIAFFFNLQFFSSLLFSGPPDPPRNCTLSNQTHDSLQVDCQEGFGSGLSQEFHMEVFTGTSHNLQAIKKN